MHVNNAVLATLFNVFMTKGTMESLLTIAAYQGPAVINNSDAAIEKILAVCAKEPNADIICFPEAFLHGYFDNATDARRQSIVIPSPSLEEMLKRFSHIKSTIIIGVNELYTNEIYNTALVIEGGKLIGSVRKSTTYPPYDYYSLSDECQVFYKNGIGYGIAICCDINYLTRVNQLACQGAQIVFCPMWNIVERSHNFVPYMHSKNHLVSKALENKVWMVCSDVIAHTETTLGVGCSCIIDPLGNVVANAQPLTENILIYHIPSFSFEPKYSRLSRIHQEKYLEKYSFS